MTIYTVIYFIVDILVLTHYYLFIRIPALNILHDNFSIFYGNTTYLHKAVKEVKMEIITMQLFTFVYRLRMFIAIFIHEKNVYF
jgi:hypothetical protein